MSIGQKLWVCGAALLLAAAASAAASNDPVCNIVLGERHMTAVVKKGLVTAICPPAGKAFKVAYRHPDAHGWDLTRAKSPDNRWLLSGSDSAKPTNLHITFTDESQMELELSVEGG